MPNKDKARFLGIPYGTACNRLRKQLLFDAVSRLGENICCRCQEVILSVDDFTIDHIKPWLNRSEELFWSLDNIGYAHSKCNTPHKLNYNSKWQRKVGPEGTAWCTNCQDFRLETEFRKNKSNWNNLQSECASCMKCRNSSVGRASVS